MPFRIINGPDVQNLMDLLRLLIFIVVMGKGENNRKALQMTPTADVQEVRHGKWISNDLGGYKWAYYCGECGGVGGYPFNDRHKYCPNCGAKMDGEREIDTNKG